MKLLSTIFTALVYIITIILAALNFITIGFVLYLWSNGTTLASALWDGFVLYTSVGFIGFALLAFLFISAKWLDHASFKYVHRK